MNYLYKLLFMSMLWSISMYCQAQKTIDFYPSFSHLPVEIDGQANEAVWQSATWYPLDQLMAGTEPSKEDFSGRFQLAWDANYLYIRAEIIDDRLVDQHADPLYFYWDDDCLEIFIDANASGGNHQFDHNAFAYHVALDNQSVDIAAKNDNGEPIFALFNQHVTSAWQRNLTAPYALTWEVAVEIHDESFSLQADNPQASRLQLAEHQIMGFMLAYCDNDNSEHREHFIGSTAITPVNGDRNLGYITADVFSRIQLIK